jgi:two-component system CheB/CheR fusion protein
VLRVVGVGASAGGLEAFTEFLRAAPTDSNVAYILVQHLDPTHRSLLVELLAKSTSLPVREVTDQMPATPNEVHVIPPNCDLTIMDGVLHLSPREKSSGGSRTIDHFLRTLAADQGDKAVAVILSGAGSDGSEGIKAVKAAGGLTLAQFENDARYDSMPRSAIATGCVDFVLPAEKMPAEIVRTLRRPSGAKKRAATNARKRTGALGKEGSRPFGDDGTDGVDLPPGPADQNLRKIFFLLRGRTGVDFSLYRINTIRRRLERRLGLAKVSDLSEYLQLLRRHPAEIDALYQDLLINVSSFFRNPGVFEALKKRVFPKIVEQHDGSDAVRIWIAGCAMGQEAYSMAIAYSEFASQSGTEVPLQIFATDVNSNTLEWARAGRYTPAQLENVSPARLARHFTRDGENYRVQKVLRDRVVFAPQNLLSHPPFTRLDLISCRNVLIYVESALQQKIIPTFHYALRPAGYLVLGSSESVGQFTNLFESREKSNKIFLKKPAASWLRLARPSALPVRTALDLAGKEPETEFNAHDAQKEADRLTLAKYVPASVLVDETGNILQFRGDTRAYLDLPKGRATFQLMKMARSGLDLPLTRLIQQAKRRNRAVRERGLIVEGRGNAVDLEVVPLRNLKRRCFLVFFYKVDLPPPPAEGRKGRSTRHSADRVAELRAEYARAREHLATLQEAHDTSVEELQSSNEEVQSSNEELQSLNEELETSNEELESSNEELTTLNEELGTRNNELRESERRLREQHQLLELAPVLVRSPKDRILYWNRGAEKLYGFTKDEALGQICHILLGTHFSEPLEAILARLWRDGKWEGEVQQRRKDGTALAIAAQWVVHYDDQGKARAVLEANADISGRKRAEDALRASESFNRSILDSSPDCVCVLDLEGRLQFMTPEALRLMEIEDFRSVAGGFWPNFWEGEHRAAAETAYRAALQGRPARFQALGRRVRGTARWWDVAIRPVVGAQGRPERMLAVARDISDAKQAELSAADALQERGRLYEEAMAARAEVEVLNQVGQSIAAELSADRLTATVARAATRLSRAEFGAFFYNVPVADGRVLSRVSMASDGNGPVPPVALPDEIEAVTRPAHSSSPARFDDLGSELLSDYGSHLRLLANHLAVRSCLVAPVISRSGDVLGALFIGHGKPGMFTERDERMVAGLAAQASVAMDNAHVFDQLERKVEERTERLRETIAELQAFSYTISHDLRAPLRAMQSYAQALKEDHGAELTDGARRYLTRIEVAGLRLDRLIQDVLTYSRVSQGSVAPKEVDLDRLVREIVDQYPNLRAAEAAVTIEGHLPNVLADEASATQCFSNLLGNALKFVPKDRAPRVRIFAQAREKSWKVWIEDNGIGISPDDQERIFKMFERVAADGEYDGTGIGLAIVRKAMERMGGTVGLESDLGQGSRFWLEFSAP